MIFAAIASFANAVFAIFDGFGRAIADASHAMGAMIAPNRLPGCQMNVVQRAEFHALSATDAVVGGVKLFGIHKVCVEALIDRAAFQLINGGDFFGREGFSLKDIFGAFFQHGTRLLDDFSAFFGRWDIEHGNIIFRHSYR